jgi:hypothetical protein
VLLMGCRTEYQPHRFANWATRQPPRWEIVLLLCAAIVQIELRGRQEQDAARALERPGTKLEEPGGKTYSRYYALRI